MARPALNYGSSRTRGCAAKLKLATTHTRLWLLPQELNFQVLPFEHYSLAPAKIKSIVKKGKKERAEKERRGRGGEGNQVVLKL